MKYAMLSSECKANGKFSQIEGYESSVAYRVLATSPVSVAIATKGDQEYESFDVIHFKSADRFWIYSPGEFPGFEDHTRFFYVRKLK
jgi:hypothetical protein